MQESFLLEPHINEIYAIINENQSSFDGVWDSIKEKIKNAVGNIKSKEDAANYLVTIYKKIQHFPEAIRNKTIKYALSLLIATFGLTTLMGALPDNAKESSEKIMYGKSFDTIIPLIRRAPTKSSKKIHDFIKNEEGFSLKAYSLGDGMITVGWGHAEIRKKSQFKVGQIITQEKAQQLFNKDIKDAENGLNRILNDWREEGIKVKINQDMYDAMISMIFNMGIGRFRNSNFIKLVKQNKLKEAQNKILTTSAKYPGVKERRKEESTLFGKGMLALATLYALKEYIKREISELL